MAHHLLRGAGTASTAKARRGAVETSEMSRHHHSHKREPSSRGDVQDFAFADTVVASDLEEPVPASGIVVSDELCVTALSYPLPEDVYASEVEPQQDLHATMVGAPQVRHATASHAADEQMQMHMQMQMQMQVQPMQMQPMQPMQMQPDLSWWDTLRFRMMRSREEMTLLWSATASLEHVHDGTGERVYEEDPLARAKTVGRRVRTLWSFFEWDRTDLVRAAWIGLVVFVLTATVGAFVLSSS